MAACSPSHARLFFLLCTSLLFGNSLALFNFTQVTSSLSDLAKESNNFYLIALNSIPDVKKTVYAAIQQTVNDTNAFLEKVADPELLYVYGRSPPVYPSPVGTGADGWADAYSKAKAIVANMTDFEKATITLGDSTNNNGCSGFSGSAKRHGFPGICLNDAENGVRGPPLVSGYASQISVGASWNIMLAWQRAHFMGKEFKAKGVNVALGPVVGPIGRLAKGGRNWEGFSTDPFLSGMLVGPTIRGLQQSVTACVKHFIANEQETQRQPFLLGFVGEIGRAHV